MLYVVAFSRYSICSIQMVKNQPTMRETWVWSLSWEDPLGEGMATHFSILSWRIPWTEEPGGPQSLGSQRVRHDWATKHSPVWINLPDFLVMYFEVFLPLWTSDRGLDFLQIYQKKGISGPARSLHRVGRLVALFRSFIVACEPGFPIPLAVWGNLWASPQLSEGFTDIQRSHMACGFYTRLHPSLSSSHLTTSKDKKGKRARLCGPVCVKSAKRAKEERKLGGLCCVFALLPPLPGELSSWGFGHHFGYICSPCWRNWALEPTPTLGPVSHLPPSRRPPHWGTRVSAFPGWGRGKLGGPCARGHCGRFLAAFLLLCSPPSSFLSWHPGSGLALQQVEASFLFLWPPQPPLRTEYCMFLRMLETTSPQLNVSRSRGPLAEWKGVERWGSGQWWKASILPTLPQQTHPNAQSSLPSFPVQPKYTHPHYLHASTPSSTSGLLT